MEMVSIIVPAFNAEKDISGCLNSLHLQEYSNIEIIVVNDGSTDKTCNIVMDYIKKDGRIRIINNNKKGVSSARNYGIINAKGMYVAFVDSDDIVSTKFIRILLEMISNKNCDCACVGITNDYNSFDKIEISKTFEYDSKEKYVLLAKRNGFACNKLYKRDILIKNNIFFSENVSVGEDMLFNYEYFRVSNNLMYSEVYLYYYKLNYSSAVNRLDNVKWFDLIKVYEAILNNKFLGYIQSEIEFNFSQVLLEAIYRFRFCKINNEQEYRIIRLKKQYARCRKCYSITQNTKIFLFLIFPTLSMKYKRRKIKD